MPEQLTDVGRGISLCNESFGDPGDPPVLLVMGLGTQMIAWHEDFCAELAARGLHVVRFDNRDSGRSTHVGGRPPGMAEIVTRRIGSDRYDLGDMADDAAGLLESLDLAPAHVVGASMGGMVAQTLTAHRPELVRSLVSIMSMTGSRWTGQPAFGIYRHLLRRAPRERDAYVEHTARVFELIGSPRLPQDPEHVREMAARSYDRGHDAAATGRQLAAVLASGDRTDELQKIDVPTTVIHGDSDRLVRPSGGRATARAIPGARLIEIQGMGHDLPRAAWPVILDAIAEQARRVDGVREAA
jgi:pimeloyl-ACP methyl ester carboxylesterase